jgi:hypothetical protein
MVFCIFCDSELDASTKPEHVLLTALGGRKSTRRADCSFHNGVFGGGIDKTFAEQVPAIRNLLQLESGRGKPPPGLKGVKAGAETLNIAPDGTPTLVTKPFEVTRLPNGRFDLKIDVSSEEELQRIAPHIAAQLGMAEADLWPQLEAIRGTVVHRRPDRLHLPLSLGGQSALRSVVKSCLVLLATKAGSEPLRAEPFAAAREFVLEGGDAFDHAHASLDPRALPGLDIVTKAYGPLFNLITVRSDEVGRTIGHFTLYNVIAWQVVLAEQGGPPNVAVSLASNPLDPSIWSDKLAEEIDIPFGWLNQPDRTDHIARSKDRLDAMCRLYFDRARERETEKVVDEAFRRQLRPGETALDVERSKLVFVESAHRLARQWLGVPQVEEFIPKRPQDEAS